ncbi:MAG TPA: hypothetical protein DCQ92_14840 [Verrucomicrobia subdivision 3 bacterium]|nr:hypothetical protein [Limisphaerales bacterium]
MTPQEAAKLVNWPDPNRVKEIHEFILTASPRDIQLFIHNIPAKDFNEWFNRARVSLDIRLAENAERTAQKLVTGTDRLITETGTLVKLTHRLYILTIVLIVLGSFEIFKFLFGLFCHL